MEGVCPSAWKTDASCRLVTAQSRNVKLTVNNVLKETRILNVFGVIKGFEEPGKDPCFFLSLSLSLYCSTYIFLFFSLLSMRTEEGVCEGWLGFEKRYFVCSKGNCLGVNITGS